MKKFKAKKTGAGLLPRTFEGKSGKTYLVFRTREGGYHVFAEIEARRAAVDCGAPKQGNTRSQWASVWDADELDD